MPRSFADRGYFAGLAGVLTLEAVGATVQVVAGVPVPIVTVIAAAFVVACMVRIHGLRGTMAFMALVFAIPYGSEFFGVLTGVPYGTYTYSGLVGPLVLGLVPIFIFIAWIHISYLAIATTTLGFGRSSLWLAPLDGLIAAAWDVIVDPLAVRAGLWSWTAPGGFYGVPLSNFLGWFLVVTILSVVARAVWARDLLSPARVSRTSEAILPVLLLGTSLSFAGVAIASSLPLAGIVGLIVLVPAAATALVRTWSRAPGPDVPSPWPRPAARVTVSRTEDRTGRA